MVDPADALDDEEYEDYGELSDMDDMVVNAPEHEVDEAAMIHEAVDEFIEDKKGWFRDLHRQHGDEDVVATAIAKGKSFKPGTAMHIPKAQIPIAGEIEEDSAEAKQMLKERTLYQFSDKETDDE